MLTTVYKEVDQLDKLRFWKMPISNEKENAVRNSIKPHIV